MNPRPAINEVKLNFESPNNSEHMFNISEDN